MFIFDIIFIFDIMFILYFIKNKSFISKEV